jgi:leucyl aminopeptidase (aminopeptidase T)
VLETLKANPDIYVSLSASKIGKDPYGMQIGYVGRDGKKYNHIVDKLMDGDKRVRGFWSPTGNVEMFKRCVAVDYGAMQSLAARIKKALDGGKEIHVTSPGGTDVTFSIEGRKAQVDDGNYRLAGMGGNLPAGETFVSPVVASTRGVIAFDGTVDLPEGSVIPKKPVKVTFKDGYVDKVTGGKEAVALLKVIHKGEAMAREKGLKAEEKNARHLGELGIGINYAAKMTCNLLEDEKVGKTVHFAIGSNYDYDAEALIHQDCLVLRPSLWVDGKQIMKDGDLLDTF